MFFVLLPPRDHEFFRFLRLRKAAMALQPAPLESIGAAFASLLSLSLAPEMSLHLFFLHTRERRDIATWDETSSSPPPFLGQRISVIGPPLFSLLLAR